MYRVQFHSSIEDLYPDILHEPGNSHAPQLRSGTITQYISEIDKFEFEIGEENKFYSFIRPYKHAIKVINLFNNKVEFFGRVLTIEAVMDSTGRYYKRILCEDFLGWLHDSAQVYKKVTNNGVRDYIQRIIDEHNSQVTYLQRFVLGNVTINSTSDIPHRYIGYDSTFDTINERVIKAFGGYVRCRFGADNTRYIDFLSSVGRESTTPIEVGTNLKSASKELDFSEYVSRLVPLGADLKTNNTATEEYGQQVVRPRLTIASINGGVNYIKDAKLEEMFGIRQVNMDWADIDKVDVLKSRGEQFMKQQKAVMATWEVEVTDNSLLYPEQFETFEVGNTHPIVNPPLSGVEKLQIIEKTIDIHKPQKVTLKIGADSKTLSAYQNAMREATKSIEKFRSDQEANRLTLEKIKQLQDEQAKLIASGTTNTDEKMKELQAQIDALKAQLGG